MLRFLAAVTLLWTLQDRQSVLALKTYISFTDVVRKNFLQERKKYFRAEEEGIEFKLLQNPTKILGNEDGWVSGMEVIKMELGEPDDSGRRRPVPIEGSEEVIDVDTVVVAIGQTPNPLIRKTTKGLDTNKRGCIIADEDTGKTSKDHVYAGGDVVTGAATVILAMGAGKAAAAAIDEELSK